MCAELFVFGVRRQEVSPRVCTTTSCLVTLYYLSTPYTTPPHSFSTRFLKFLGILTLESFCSSALGLAVGAAAPSTDAAVAIGPAVMLVWIIFGGYYCNSENIPRCAGGVCFPCFETYFVSHFETFEKEILAPGCALAASKPPSLKQQPSIALLPSPGWEK